MVTLLVFISLSGSQYLSFSFLLCVCVCVSLLLSPTINNCVCLSDSISLSYQLFPFSILLAVAAAVVVVAVVVAAVAVVAAAITSVAIPPPSINCVRQHFFHLHCFLQILISASLQRTSRFFFRGLQQQNHAPTGWRTFNRGLNRNILVNGEEVGRYSKVVVIHASEPGCSGFDSRQSQKLSPVKIVAVVEFNRRSCWSLSYKKLRGVMGVFLCRLHV